jgi:uncharacterized protein GlcG (DUF336 family)
MSPSSGGYGQGRALIRKSAFWIVDVIPNDAEKAMRPSLSIASALFAPLLLALPAAAQPPGAFGGGFGGPPPGPNPALARQAAEAAVKACERMGYKTMATVVDTTGQPVVAMTADPQLSKELAPESVRRARVAAKFHTASSDIVDRVGTDAGMYYIVQGDARLRPVKAGGVPYGATGALGVAGAPDGVKDEACARAGMKAIAAQLARARGPGGARPAGAGGGGPAPAEDGGRRGEGE